MVDVEPKVNLFPFIGAEHPFYPLIHQFKSLLIEPPPYRDMIQRINNGEKATVRTAMRASPTQERGWKLKSVYLSFQFRDQLKSFPFRSLTFLYTAKTGGIDCYRFPQDPYLISVASFFEGNPFLQTEVLRYVPFRRLTFRALSPTENDPPVVGKFMRVSELEKAYHRMVKVSLAVQRSPSTFRVPTPKKIDTKNGALFMKAEQGKELTTLLNKDNVCDLLHSVGLILRDFHALDVRDFPQWDFEDFLEGLAMRFTWIVFHRPDQAPFLNDVLDLLLKRVPRIDPEEYAVCHGDFRSPHLLKDDECWSAVDLDEIMRGDPYFDIARIIAFLKYDVPLFMDWFMDLDQERANRLEDIYEFFLNGYQERAQRPLNRKRLLWYRIASEIYYLARIIKKDLFSPTAFYRTIGLIHNLSEQFRSETGGSF